MKRFNRILIGIACFALLITSWVIAVNARSDSEKQLELMARAAALTDDGIYVRAVPLLEEAARYNAEHTLAAEAELKRVYLALAGQRGFHRRYMNLLESQMSRKDAAPEIFAEAANYYLRISRLPDALAALRLGIERTGSEALRGIYESNRYVFQTGRAVYDYAAAIQGSAAQVRVDGLWGIARADGALLIPCEYEKISTFSSDRAIVRQGDEIFAVNSDNNRVAKLQERVLEFGNLAGDRVPLLFEEGWRRATGEFIIGSSVFEQIGTYSGGFAAAKLDGAWGVIDLATNWLIPPEYDEIVLDELGRCYARGAVFTRKGGAVYLYVDGLQTEHVFEDARPFSGEGYAAVRNNGKWGYIDVDGTLVIDFFFDDALSFGQHLAAVKWGDLWGYISSYGQFAINPIFIEAKSFSNGSAPVLTERGWQFITLIEYMRGAGIGL